MVKRLGFFALLVAVSGVAYLVFRTPDVSVSSATSLGGRVEKVERGRYLAAIGNCESCHTPEGGAAYSGGVKFTTPLGTIYSTNITSDPRAGIGSWTEAEFRRAMHEGIRKDGSRLFPAFPYTSFTKVSDDDVGAIYEYFRTVPPSPSTPPANSFVFSQRWTMAVWNWLFLKAERYEPERSKSPEWNRGAYLIEGLAHCGACHSPRNLLMAEIEDRAFEGGTIWDHGPTGAARSWHAVNLTTAKSGLGSWRDTDIKNYLLNGYSQRAGVFGPMNDVYSNSTRFLNESDASAMAIYLKSLPPRGEYTGSPPSPESVAGGSELYAEHCEECHGSSGRGSLFGGPPLAGSAIAQSVDPSSLLNVILHGPQSPEDLELGNWEDMPSYGEKLNDQDVARVANFVRSTWGNRAPEVSSDDVKAQR